MANTYTTHAMRIDASNIFPCCIILSRAIRMGGEVRMLGSFCTATRLPLADEHAATGRSSAIVGFTSHVTGRTSSGE